MTYSQLEIDWLPINAIASELNRHPSQVRRDRAVLSELGLITYTKNGMSYRDYQCLKLFRQLVDGRGRDNAISQIGKKWDEYQRQRESTQS